MAAVAHVEGGGILPSVPVLVLVAVPVAWVAGALAHKHCGPQRTAGARAMATLAAAAVVLLLLAACAATPQPAPTTTTGAVPTPSNGSVFDKAIPVAVADLPFVNQDSKTVTLASLHGKTVVLADFLTLCQEICPLTSANFRQIDQAVEAAGQSSEVDLVEITVDPARDTPARLAAYQEMFGAQPNWQFLTGSASQVATLWKTLGVSYEKVAEDPGPPPIDWWTGKPLTYDVNHQDVVFVLGKDGHEKWLVEGTPDTQGVQPPSTLLKFLNDAGTSNLAHPEAPSWTAADVEQGVSYATGHKVG